MRRTLLIVLAAALACLRPLTVSPAQATVAPITGTLISASGDFTDPLAGATVALYSDGGSGPGSFISSTTTAGDGSFSFGAGLGNYYLKFTLPDYRQGWLGDGYVQTDVTYATPVAAATNLGDVYMVPAYIKGYVINPATGKRVSGIKVTARDQRGETPEAVDYTNSRGVFVLTGIQCEDDCKLYFRGNPVNYQNGYRACNATLVSTWGAACASPLAFIGKVKVHHL